MSSLNYSYFLAVYKDRIEDTWVNVSFVNNCKTEIKNLKVESTERGCIKGSGLSEVLRTLNLEYANIPAGEYLLLEKLDSSDRNIDSYRYSLEIEIGEKSEKIRCCFCIDDLSENLDAGLVPVVNETGRMYFL